MKRIAIIGDVHGRLNWQDIPYLKDYDKIIFMGDYLDPYGDRTSYDETWAAFQDVLTFKKKYGEKVVCLFGNHDQHYLNECCGAGSRKDYNMAEHYKLNDLFHNLLESGTLQLAYHIPGTDILCIHAGLSHFWYNTHILGKEWDVAKREPVISIKPHDPEAVEELAKQLNNYPKLGVLSFADVYWDVYGYSDHQGFLWWRCMTEWGSELQEKEMLAGFTQVMGHTQMAKLNIMKGKERDVAAVFVDGLGSNWYTELAIKDNGQYQFIQVNIPQ